MGLLGGLNELRGVKPGDQLLAQPQGSVGVVPHSPLALALPPAGSLCQEVILKEEGQSQRH